MNKPVIGVVPLIDKEKESYWMLPGYMEGILRAGGIPVMLPLLSEEVILEQLVDEMNGFLFTGGQDVSPAFYAESLSPMCGECCEERDEMENILFRLAYRKDKPILGICRGIQFINVAMGGTLYQDLPTQHASDIEHQQTPPYDRPVHSVKILSDSPLYKLLKTEKLMVNSYHHQAIKKLAPKTLAMAISEDNITEALYVPKKKFVWAVQWHPELSFADDDNSRRIFKEFVSHC